MKDDKEHIDQLFQSLNDRQFDIPEAFLEDLNKRLDNEPKKRKRFSMWFLIPLVLIGAIGIGYFYNADQSEVKTPAEQMNKLIAKDEYKANLNTQNNNLLKEQNQNNHSLDSASIPSSAKDLPAGQTSLEKRQFSSRIKVHKQKKSNSKVLVDNQTKRIKSKKNGTLQTQLKSKVSKSKTKENMLNPGNNNPIPEEIKQTSIPDVADNTKSIVKPEKEELSKEPVSETEKDSVLALNKIDSVQQVDSSLVEKNAIKSKSPANNWKKEIGFFAGLGGNMMHDSPKNSEYLTKINQNRTSILAPSFGVNANLSYKRFTFGSGINYEQTGEKFKVDIKSDVLKDSTYAEFIQDTIWVQDSIGNWIPIPHDTTIYHTVQYTESAWSSRSFQNRYSWISIPLHFGYRFELGNYELIPRIGAVFNFGIAHWAGTYPNDSFTDVRQYPPAKFTVSYLIQLEARRNFDKWFVFINPYFRSMINPSVSGDVIRRRYSSWGMQFGIGLNF